MHDGGGWGSGLGLATLPALSIDGAAMNDVLVSTLDLAGSMGGRMRIDGILGQPGT